ncbi:MAG: ketopantoate reductase family protein [Ignavibacteria bacterium]
MSEKLNILVAGTGAIGGYFGSFLALNPNLNVCFLSRGKALAHFKRHPLRIQSSLHKDFKVKIIVFDKVTSFKKKFDYVLVCTKSKDTENLIPEIQKVITRNTQVVTLQNGLYNYRILKKHFGKSHCLQAVCKIGAEVDKKFVVRHSSLGFLVIGEENGKPSKRISLLHDLLSSSGIKTKVSDDFQNEVWIKFAWNSIFNTLTGIFPVTVNKLFENQETARLVEQFYSEFKKIAKANGVRFGAVAYKKVITDSINLGAFKSSAYQDRLKHKELETPYFTSELIRMAKSKKIDIPVITYLHYLSKAVSLLSV